MGLDDCTLGQHTLQSLGNVRWQDSYLILPLGRHTWVLWSCRKLWSTEQLLFPWTLDSHWPTLVEFCTIVTICFWLSRTELSMGVGQAEFWIPISFLATGDEREQVFCWEEAFCMLVLCSMKRSGLLCPDQPQRQTTGLWESTEKRGLLLSDSTSPNRKKSMDIQSWGWRRGTD